MPIINIINSRHFSVEEMINALENNPEITTYLISNNIVRFDEENLRLIFSVMSVTLH